MNFETVALNEKNNALVIIDQTKLPHDVVMLVLTELQEIWDAIYQLKVRGAPAIGVAAAIGLYVVTQRINETDYQNFLNAFNKAKEFLASSRPTAVNLFWALNRMERIVLTNADKEVPDIKTLLHDEAIAIKDEDIRVCRAIGEYGLSLIKDGDGILTHCNAGRLAAVKYGTALAPIYIGLEKGFHFRVFTDETRPLLQGMRLSAFELVSSGVETTVICDNMASQVMKNGWVQAVFVGCDRVAANGDVCNKIGTSGVAILAKHYGIPFYVCTPTSTIDMKIENSEDIPIEQRPAEEMTTMWFQGRMAPEGVNVFNPAFDVTDHSLVTAIVTEYGIAKAPYTQSLKAIMEKKGEGDVHSPK